MIFDQYSRYFACAKLVEHLGLAEGGVVLDVGSGPECLFGAFLPGRQITYLDPLIADGDPNHISGDVFSAHLDGMRFSTVVAVDVLEHIPADLRLRFLERITRLSSDAIVLGFPCSDEPEPRETDWALGQQFRQVYGTEYPWLKEHYEYGLPSLADTRASLGQLGWHCQVVGHGHAPWLRELLGFVLCVWERPEYRELVMSLSERFNRDLVLHDFTGPFYRQFIVATRSLSTKPFVPDKNAQSLDDANRIFRDLMEYAHSEYFKRSLNLPGGAEIARLGAVLAQREMEIAERDAEAERLESMIERQTAEIAERGAKVSRLESMVERQTAEITERGAKVSRLESMVERQVAEISKRDAMVTRLESILEQGGALGSEISRRDIEIAWLKQSLASGARQLDDVYRSMSWRITAPLRFILRAMRYRGIDPKDKQYLVRILSKWSARLCRQGIKKQSLPQAANNRECQPQGPVAGLEDVFVWGVIDWHFRIQRPQHIARELATAGRRVFYFTNVFVDENHPGFSVEKLDDSGRLYQVALHLSRRPSIYAHPPGHDELRQLLAGMGMFIEWSGSQVVLNLVQHAYWLDVAVALPNSRLVYDCMDHHEGFGGVSEEMLVLERRLAELADLLVVTSQWLDEEMAPANANREIIRNACQYEHFCQKPARCYRDEAGRKIIGYYGAIAEWFDLELVSSVAQAFPGCLVMLVGADTCAAQAVLSRHPNIRFTGEVPYADLPYYLYAFDVCMLPFRVGPLTLATNPVKLYEYLSAGKPVVAVDIPEMRQFGDLVRVASNHADFVGQLNLALQEASSEESVSRRRAFAAEQTWAHRAEQLSTAIRDLPIPKVSIVVVTYNNLDFTKTCLLSLEEQSNYPNLEIVVVDNDSSDGTQEYLQDWADGAKDRKLILNDQNRGFAAANNQGLAMATGEYLAMLNNDTVVTTGWVRTLLNHLRRDSRIGIVGPVTNNIGNEARIDVHYNSMEEMRTVVARYTRAHLGEEFPIRTAAFFCVMLPRAVYEKVGSLDEAFGRGFFEDDDYCRRIEQLGLRVVCAEDVFVHHHLSASFSKLKDDERRILFERNKAVYEAKWGRWVPHGYRARPLTTVKAMEDVSPKPAFFKDWEFLSGTCNVCGKDSRFFYNDPRLWREQLVCEHCLTTSRYRSIASGILRAIEEIDGASALSLSQLPDVSKGRDLAVYDTQPAFYYDPCAYPIPDILNARPWVDVSVSQFKPDLPFGVTLSDGVSNQNLECLTFGDESFDLVITSDVMEHVRLDNRAHREIYRVLKPGGRYIFTVPHDRSLGETLIRVKVTDSDDPAKDIHLLEPEYHGDTNNPEAEGVLSYRVYGRDLEQFLSGLGFEVEYILADNAQNGILNAELYFCKKILVGVV